jgi:trehalose 2-sulfotransferase
MPIVELPGKPTLTCVICSLPRSGSTLLSFGLGETGYAGRPREYLGPRTEGAYAEKWSLPKRYTLRSFLTRMAAESMTSNGVSALKIHLYDLMQVLQRAREEFDQTLSERDLLEACFPNPRCIFIRRADKVRQAISFLRALDSMQWRRLHTEPVSERMAVLNVDVQKIGPIVQTFSEQEAEWRSFFQRNDLTVHEVRYEDLAEAYAGTVLGALEFLGVGPATDVRLGPPRLARQSDRLTDEAVAAYLRHAGGTAGETIAG